MLLIVRKCVCICASIHVRIVERSYEILYAQHAACGKNKDRLHFGGRKSPATQRALGAGLATIHNAPPAPDWPQKGVYGFPLDGCCGALAQPNNPTPKPILWVEFWAEHR